jgi:hypothetical protein
MRRARKVQAPCPSMDGTRACKRARIKQLSDVGICMVSYAQSDKVHLAWQYVPGQKTSTSQYVVLCLVDPPHLLPHLEGAHALCEVAAPYPLSICTRALWALVSPCPRHADRGGFVLRRLARVCSCRPIF